MRLLLVLSTLALGPFGAIGTLVTYLRVWALQRRATPFEEWYRMLFPEAEISRSDALHRLLVRGGSTVTGNVSPFRDIMSDRNETRKRTVLSLIVDYFVPEYAPALQRGLVDADPTIRVSAATAMAAIEGRYLARGTALEAFVARHPADINAKYALATHLDDYAFTGLLDPVRVSENRKRALTLYRDYAETHNDPESWNRIGRLLVRLGQMDEAAKVYGGLLETYPDYIPALTWSMEYAYGQRRFDIVRELAERTARLVESGMALPPEIRDAIKAWEDAI
jgi:tetratricopeptide (TPR) repeat protein